VHFFFPAIEFFSCFIFDISEDIFIFFALHAATKPAIMPTIKLLKILNAKKLTITITTHAARGILIFSNLFSELLLQVTQGLLESKGLPESNHPVPLQSGQLV